MAVGISGALTLLFLVGSPPRPAYAGTLTFPGCGATIQTCIDSANPGDTIFIQSGDYSASLTLSKAVSLTGALSSTTILHALPNTRVLTVTGAAVDSSVVISGLTVTGGNVQAAGGNCPDACGGGLIIVNGAQPQLRNMIVMSNVAWLQGGGVYADGNLAMTNVQFINNLALAGNGGGAAAQGTATLLGGLFMGNQAGGSGGGMSSNASALINGTKFMSNTAAVAGGGLAGGPATLLSAQFVGNTSNQSGGGAWVSGTVTIEDGVFQSNQSLNSGLGGGLYANGLLELSDVAFLGNRGQQGAGLYLQGGNGRFTNDLFAGNQSSGGDSIVALASPGNVALLHNTFVSPTLGSGAAIVVHNGTVGITNTIIASYTTGISRTAGNVREDYNLFFADGVGLSGSVTSGGHSLTGNPAFRNPAGGDYRLGSGSPAIDTGTDAGVTTDFSGEPRPFGAGFDMGIDEWTGNANSNVGLVKTASASMVQPGQTLTYTVAFSNAGPYIAAGGRLTDIVPANLSAVTYTSSGALLTPIGSSQYAWQVAYLTPGAGGILTMTGVLRPAARGTVFTNTATISAAYTDTNPANNSSAVSVTVANAPPVAVADAYALPANSTLPVTAPGVLVNDTDANGDALTAALATGPLTGTIDLAPSGAFTYTPPLGFAGVVTFTYQANDGLADSNAATVTLAVGEFKLYVPLVRR